MPATEKTRFPRRRRARIVTPTESTLGPSVRLLDGGAASRSIVEVTSEKSDNPLYRAFRALRALGVQIVHAEVRPASDRMIQRLQLMELDGSSLAPARIAEVLVALSRVWTGDVALPAPVEGTSLCA